MRSARRALDSSSFSLPASVVSFMLLVKLCRTAPSLRHRSLQRHSCQDLVVVCSQLSPAFILQNLHCASLTLRFAREKLRRIVETMPC